MPTETRQVPIEALQCSGDAALGVLQFAAKEGDGASQPLKMRARSGQGIEHWYWGKIVHDMAGFRADHERIPVDYCHNPNEVLGFLDSFKAEDEGLDVAGQLVSTSPTDRAAEVLSKGRAGVPYQSSIFFRPESIEEVLSGGTAQVNGYELAGPAIIIRKWSLRGVAVCPYGADHQTASKFSDGSKVAVTFTTEPDAMSKDSKPETKPEPKPSVPTEQAEVKPEVKPGAKPDAQPQADHRAEFTAELKRFTDRFGVENGTKWFADGKTYEQALELHADAQAEVLKAKDKSLDDANAKLSSIDRGGPAPVTFRESDDKGGTGTAPKEFAHLGESRAKLAAGIKLPNKK